MELTCSSFLFRGCLLFVLAFNSDSSGRDVLSGLNSYGKFSLIVICFAILNFGNEESFDGGLFMDTGILAVLELRLRNAEENAHKYAIESLTATNQEEKCRNEVELAYHLGKAKAYVEVRKLLNGGSHATVELRRLIERAAEEVLKFHAMEYLKGTAYGSEPGDTFENGVEALKQQLIRLIDPQSFDINVVIGNKNQERSKEDFDL